LFEPRPVSNRPLLEKKDQPSFLHLFSASARFHPVREARRTNQLSSIQQKQNNNTAMKIKAITTAILTLAFAIPANADQYIIHVYSTRIVPGLSSDGFRILDTTMTPLLSEGQTHTVTITPRYGTRVKLVAVGDVDSNDVDMFVVGGESGRDIDRDTLGDDIPVCEFTARGGSYEVTIRVHDTNRPAYVKLVYSTR